MGIVVRSGCQDIWNAFMVTGATFSENDIPLCPSTVDTPPTELISFVDAKALHKKMLRAHQTEYHKAAYVHFYIDDQKFDGKRSSIWLFPDKALEILRHFEGVITPDFSTYQDFPEPLKIYNTYRMRAFGYWLGMNGISVINNVRWGTPETYRYCFSGIPKHAILAIGTCGGSPRNPKSKTKQMRGGCNMYDFSIFHSIEFLPDAGTILLGIKMGLLYPQSARNYVSWKIERDMDVCDFELELLDCSESTIDTVSLMERNGVQTSPYSWRLLRYAILCNITGNAHDMLQNIESVYTDFDYPEDMKTFIYYMPCEYTEMESREPDKSLVLIKRFQAFLAIEKKHLCEFLL